jgi:hypothetical protein
LGGTSRFKLQRHVRPVDEGYWVTKDIGSILDGWEYEPDQISVRIVAGEDGREKLQLRLDLGLMQMEMDGRPDGQRPEGKESWLDHYEEVQREHDREHVDATPFELDAEALARLLREGIQYYHRYISFWHLDRYELCARDTARNLRLFAFVRNFATRDRDKMQFDQFRPYVTMMHTRAVATPLLKDGKADEALAAIELGIGRIESFLDEYNQTHRAKQCAELVGLQQWRREILNKQGKRSKRVPTVSGLKKQLDKAVAEERFEDAAKLRDEIRKRSAAPEAPGMTLGGGEQM